MPTDAYGEPKTLTVFPRFEPLDEDGFADRTAVSAGGDAAGIASGRFVRVSGQPRVPRGRQRPRHRLADHRPAWGGDPIALREYREEFFLRVGLVLDTRLSQRGSPRERVAERGKALEDAVSLCAAIGDYVARKEYIVDLFAAGPDLFHLTAGRQLAYLDQILDILACVEASAAEPLEIVAPQLQAYIARLTTVVCVFLHWNETRRRFVDGLRASGAGVKVILIEAEADSHDDDAACPVPGDVQRLTPGELQAGVREL